MDGIYAILGIFMLYATGHFFVIQNDKVWSKRTSYEKFVTCFAIATIVLVYIGTMNS